MQHAASIGQSAPTRKLSPAVAGLAAAAIASAITLVMVMSNAAPQTSSEPAASTTANQCQQVARKLMVATTSGGGVVRLREGNYLSAPITLSATPQSVVFPLPRPQAGRVTEVLTVEGNANDVIITSDLTGFRKVLNVSGVSAFSLTWAPLKTC